MTRKPVVLALLALAGVVWLWLAMNSVPAPTAAVQQKRNELLIAEQMAYHVGVQAYIYAYPLVDMYRRMHNETHRNGFNQQVYAPINRFYRYTHNDGLYFSAWFDVSSEPLILHTPAASDYTLAITNLYAEVQTIEGHTTAAGEGLFCPGSTRLAGAVAGKCSGHRN